MQSLSIRRVFQLALKMRRRLGIWSVVYMLRRFRCAPDFSQNFRSTPPCPLYARQYIDITEKQCLELIRLNMSDKTPRRAPHFGHDILGEGVVKKIETSR
jgi:hypothetical protein